MTADVGKLRLRDVQRRFDRAANSFDDADFVHRKCFEGLVERLSPLLIKPSRILDLGSATGTGSRALAKKFRKSRVISLDASAGMLARSKAKRPMVSGIRELQADATRIPLQTGSIDLVFANLLLPWIDDLPACFAEISRVLKEGGVFAFSTLGSDSLSDFRAAWNSQDHFQHVNQFTDMHDVGDALVKAGLADPVLDVDPLTVTFSDVRALFRDLSACGARNSLAGRRRTLTGKKRFLQAKERLLDDAGGPRLCLQLELVFGHAWGTGPRLPDGEFHLDPVSIRRRNRR